VEERSVEACSATTDAWSGLSEVEPVVRGWLGRRCRNPSDVDDVVQDTLLRAARYRTGLARPERLASWALSIAANALRDRRRARSGWVVAEDMALDFEQFAWDGRAPEERGDESLLWIGGRRVTTCDALEHLQAALRTLKPGDARLLLEHYGEREFARAEDGAPANSMRADSAPRCSGPEAKPSMPAQSPGQSPAESSILSRADSRADSRAEATRTTGRDEARKCRLYRARRRLASELRTRLEMDARSRRGGP
jgi:DNA-directed RNA polymerase specialized sigma24 family protein